MSSFESWLNCFGIDAPGLWACVRGGRWCRVHKAQDTLCACMHLFFKHNYYKFKTVLDKQIHGLRVTSSSCSKSHPVWSKFISTLIGSPINAKVVRTLAVTPEAGFQTHLGLTIKLCVRVFPLSLGFCHNFSRQQTWKASVISVPVNLLNKSNKWMKLLFFACFFSSPNKCSPNLPALKSSMSQWWLIT